MKTKIIPIISILSIVTILFSSCEDSTYREYKGNAPVYMSYSDLREAVEIRQNVDLENPGKIYYKDNYIFIVEELKGIHVLDNIHEVARVRDILPYTVPPTDNEYPMAYVDEERGVVIEWEVKTIREKIYNEPHPWPIYYKGGIMFLDAANSSGASSGVSGSGTGFGGAM